MLDKNFENLIKEAVSLNEISVNLTIEQADFFIKNNQIVISERNSVEHLLDSFLDANFFTKSEKLEKKFDEVISIWETINKDSAEFYKNEFYKVDEMEEEDLDND